MKILYLLRYYPTLTETFVYREIDGLVARGHEVVIAALGQRADGALQAEPPTAAVLHIPRHPWVGRLARPGPGQQWLSEVRGKADAARLPWLLQQLRGFDRGFDRVHAHFAGGAAEWAHALSLDSGLPYSVTVHAVDLFRPRPSLHRVLTAAQTVITIAQHHRAILAERGITATVVHCGPELARWQLPTPPDGPLRALAVGRAVPKKGLDLLLQAWQQLDRPQARLELVSDLPDPHIAGVAVHGLLAPAQLREVMALSNLVVLPCRRAPDGDMDGIPVSIMEGMAAGRAVVSTAVSGIPELVDDAVGWLTPPDDLPALLTALQAACDNIGQRRARGLAGPARLQERAFVLDAQVDGLLRAWRQARI